MLPCLPRSLHLRRLLPSGQRRLGCDPFPLTLSRRTRMEQRWSSSRLPTTKRSVLLRLPLPVTRPRCSWFFLRCLKMPTLLNRVCFLRSLSPPPPSSSCSLHLTHRCGWHGLDRTDDHTHSLVSRVHLMRCTCECSHILSSNAHTQYDERAGAQDRTRGHGSSRRPKLATAAKLLHQGVCVCVCVFVLPLHSHSGVSDTLNTSATCNDTVDICSDAERLCVFVSILFLLQSVCFCGT